MTGKKSFGTGRIVLIAAVLGAIIFGCVNIVSGQLFRSSRIDLTQQHLFSLSQGTRTLIGDLNEPVRFRFFMSSGLTKEAPQLAAFASRVRSMLDAYVAGSKGNITLETIDAKPIRKTRIAPLPSASVRSAPRPATGSSSALPPPIRRTANRSSPRSRRNARLSSNMT